jgi:TATA-box binding protein (TBP) (component of TFIID and TFIIIB)
MDFGKIKVSTKTIIAVSNLVLDISKIYEKFPVFEETDSSKIYVKTIYYGNNHKGKVEEDKKKKKKSFRNAVNIIVNLNEYKQINFKLSKNGKFQLTGCKNDEQAIEVVKFFIEKLFEYCRDAIIMSYDHKITVYFQTVMTNIDFSIGYFINRLKLDELLNSETNFHSLLETSCGYTGVNVKLPLNYEWWNIEVPTITCYYLNNFKWDLNKDKLINLNPNICDKIKKKYNTFLIFHSGNIIMSGMCNETMEKDFYTFTNILQKWKSNIEEKLNDNIFHNNLNQKNFF